MAIPRRLLLVLSLIAVGLGLAGPVTAQDGTGLPVVLVYTNFQDSLVVYDGADSQVTPLIEADDARRYDYELTLAPDQGHIAVYTVSYERGAISRADYASFTYRLDVFALPDGQPVLQRDLIPPTYVPRTGAATETPGDQTYELPEALGELRWSRDGQRLAWIEGTTDDAGLWMWDAATGEATALADTPGYPDDLRWSPDGERLLYVAVETFLSEAAPTASAVYLTGIDGVAEAVPLETDSQYIWVIDWVDDTRFLWSPFDRAGGAQGLLLHDLDSGEDTVLVSSEQPLSVPKWDPGSETASFAVPLVNRAEDAPPQPGLTPGAYIIRTLGDDPELLVEADNLYGVHYTLPGYLAVGNDIVIRLDDTTRLELSELRRPDYSPDGDFALGERTSQTYLLDLTANEETLVANLYYIDGIWLDGETFLAQIGAYGSVIGVGTIEGSFRNLVEDVGNGPFVGFLAD